MRATLLAAVAAIAVLPGLARGQAVAPPAARVAPAPAPATTIVPDPDAPPGKLSDAARPTAYRLALVIDPDQPRFSGHDEIDAVVKAPTKKLYLHGRDLNVGSVVARAGRRSIAARYTQVDPTGVARLDFAEPLPAGPVTLVFDYDGAFGNDASGLYRIKVGDKWYSWTQFESIDARAAFPSFDEPGFKTPFTISIATKPGNTVVSNAPEARVTTVGGLARHEFQPTRPLPTYLVAMVTGPFLRETGAVPPSPQRGQPLPLGVVATQAQGGKLGFALAQSQPIVALLERYFDQPFPFPKLDQIGSPVMPGAMENAGADVYGDGILLLPDQPSTPQQQVFGTVVSHELAHQWFGDLVTPAWWDDIWLNESFANWMGYRIGNEWRPDLRINVNALAEGFRAMNTDALEVGRPIHQPITRNGDIDGAFDTITYGKGGQVVAMIAAYLGDEKFREGVRLHMRRHAYGNATSEQFFGALADAAKDPGVLASLKSYVDQPGVPVVTFARQDGRLVASQARYAFLGSSPAPESWTIPLCWRIDTAKSCTLLGAPSQVLGTAPAGGVVMPNVGGTGYYRFELPAADWNALIASGAGLSPGEALAASDSLWASFRAGHAAMPQLIAAARTFAANPNSSASIDGGQRLGALNDAGLIPADALPAYRRLIALIYAPRLQAIGFDPRTVALPGDTPDRQRAREIVVGLLATEAQDAGVRGRLTVAADAYLKGDRRALDPAYLPLGLTLVVERDGLPAAKRMVDLALGSEEPSLRRSALAAAAFGIPAGNAGYLLDLNDLRLRPFDRLALLAGLSGRPETRDATTEWIIANYARLTAGNGIFLTSQMPRLLSGQCGVDRAARLDGELGPKVKAAGAGELAFARTIEQVRNCGRLRAARSAEIGAAIKAS